MRAALFFTIIFLEGFVVLATELLAIRQTLPFVGSGTDTIAIIIAAVLLPLAVGYYRGGQFKPTARNKLRHKLLLNMLVALAFLVVAISYFPLGSFFKALIEIGISNRLALTSIYAAVFLICPVYLLGQTIPLTGHYFRKRALAETTGQILFFSTIGSFLGAVLTSVVLMSLIGANHTVMVVCTCLLVIILLLHPRKIKPIPVIAVILTLISYGINSNAVMKVFNIVKMDQYHTVIVKEGQDTRYLFLNHNFSAAYGKGGEKHPYIKFVEEQTIDPVYPTTDPKDILVIGAGAFTFGYEDHHNHYDYVDINKNLKDIAEQRILKAPLAANKKFHSFPARAYLTGQTKKYDVIFIDAYYGLNSIPEHLLTREFFKQVKNQLKPRGIVAINVVTSPNFSTSLSRNIDTTIRSVMPYVSRHVVNNEYALNTNLPLANVIYLYKNRSITDPLTIYTDNKNRAFLDRN